MAKKYLTDNSKNLYYANQNLNQIYNSIELKPLIL